MDVFKHLQLPNKQINRCNKIDLNYLFDIKQKQKKLAEKIVYRIKNIYIYKKNDRTIIMYYAIKYFL